jgi:hypothetical protein
MKVRMDLVRYIPSITARVVTIFFMFLEGRYSPNRFLARKGNPIVKAEEITAQIIASINRCLWGL